MLPVTNSPRLTLRVKGLKAVRRARSLPRREVLNYSPAVAFMASMVSLLFGAFNVLSKGAAGQGSESVDTVSMTIFVISLMISFPTSLWAMTLPQNSADIFARIGVVCGSMAFASVLSMFLPVGYKWLTYLICLVACLPCFFPNLLSSLSQKKVRKNPATAPLVQEAKAIDKEAGPPDIESIQ